jgi:hypothetical protein
MLLGHLAGYFTPSSTITIDTTRDPNAYPSFHFAASRWSFRFKVGKLQGWEVYEPEITCFLWDH